MSNATICKGYPTTIGYKGAMAEQIKSFFEELCDLLQIEKTHTTLYHPQKDGLVERVNRTVLNMLATVVNNHQDWESHLRPVYMTYNTAFS